MIHDLHRLRAEYLRREQHFAGQDTYTLFNPATLFAVQQRQRAVLALLRREGFYPLARRCILEVGCGAGGVLREFLAFGADPQHLHGIDLLDWRVANAKALGPHLPLACADGQNLPYPDGCFDLVLQCTVFTSILDDTIKCNVAREMRRVLNPNGLILWYDYWLNPTNPHIKGIRPAEVRALFPECRFSFHPITLALPITRLLAPRSWLACYVLERLRLFKHALFDSDPACSGSRKTDISVRSRLLLEKQGYDQNCVSRSAGYSSGACPLTRCARTPGVAS